MKITSESVGEYTITTAEVESVKNAVLLQLQPGDILAFHIRSDMSNSQMDYAKHFLREFLPEGVKFMFLNEADDVSVIRPTTS